MSDAQLIPGRRLVNPTTGWPREVVVDHGDGTCSLLANIEHPDRAQIRSRRAGDIFREEMPA